MAAHFEDENENGVSTPEEIASDSPVTVYVTGELGGASVFCQTADSDETEYGNRRHITSPDSFNVVANGVLRFEIANASAATSITVTTES